MRFFPLFPSHLLQNQTCHRRQVPFPTAISAPLAILVPLPLNSFITTEPPLARMFHRVLWPTIPFVESVNVIAQNKDAFPRNAALFDLAAPFTPITGK